MFIHDNSFPVTVSQDEFENLCSEFCLIIEALECKIELLSDIHRMQMKRLMLCN